MRRGRRGAVAFQLDFLLFVGAVLLIWPLRFHLLVVMRGLMWLLRFHLLLVMRGPVFSNFPLDLLPRAGGFSGLTFIILLEGCKRAMFA